MSFTYQSLDPVPVTKPTERNLRDSRTFQGIPGIAVLPSGRIFAVWYAGGHTEFTENFVMMVISDDNGETWSDAVAVVDPPSPDVRAFDSTFWIAPDGRFFWFWSQSSDWFDGIAGVWYSILENPEADPAEFRFTAPVRIANGIMMDKPTVLSDGTWALPVSVWTGDYKKHDSLGVVQGCYMVVSEDNGKTFHPRGRIDLARVEGGPRFDEHCFVEHNDGTIECYIRVNRGVATSISRDKGATWTAPDLSKTILGPNSRMYAVRLRSGRILLVNNDASGIVPGEKDWPVRERMTAYLSDDDGKTWPHSLLLDERTAVSYPDAQETADGSLFIIYDHERTKNGDILMARITEDDILAGRLVSPASRLKILIDHTKGVPEKQ